MSRFILFDGDQNRRTHVPSFRDIAIELIRIKLKCRPVPMTKSMSDALSEFTITSNESGNSRCGLILSTMAGGSTRRSIDGEDFVDALLDSAGQALVRRLESAIRPTWDRTCRVLCFGQILVKRFRKSAPNQERLLDCFEESNWPSHIDDPIPPTDGIVSATRLHDTIKRLNGSMENRLVIRFSGDGTGQGVRWLSLIPLIGPNRP